MGQQGTEALTEKSTQNVFDFLLVSTALYFRYKLSYA